MKMKKTKYTKILSHVIVKPNDEIIKIVIDSYFYHHFNIKIYNSKLIIPYKLLPDYGLDFVTVISNLMKELTSGDGMGYHSEEVLKNKSGQGLFSDEIKKKYGTIFTPDFVVDKCLDLAWKYYEGNKLEATICDPACGDGNFLVAAYHRLMKEDSELNPVAKSKHIIENCIYGYDIIKNMVEAAKLNLHMCHLMTCKEYETKPELIKPNIYHGNTIVIEEDTKEEWYQDRDEFEGGILCDELRDKKYDIIIGNPPYTHLRNLNNRRYHSYPKQRDLAQVFVRWALDHMTEDGVISYNISDRFINQKLSDGAKETRKLIKGKIREIITGKDISDYSINTGGDLTTCIICFNNNNSYNLILNSNEVTYDTTSLNASSFCDQFIQEQYEFKAKKITQSLSSGRSINKFGFNTKFIKSFLYYDDNSNGNYKMITKRRLCAKNDGNSNGNYKMITKCRLCAKNDGNNNLIINELRGNFKLIRTCNFKNFLNSKLEGEIKNFDVEYNYGLWLIGYLNTIHIWNYKVNWANRTRAKYKHGGITYELSNSKWKNLRVPDYDYYKENKPQQFNNYMKWIEDNIHDKDKFLEGIDDQFERLINE